MAYTVCKKCGENECVYLDLVRGELRSDGSVSDGRGEFLDVCPECYDLAELK